MKNSTTPTCYLIGQGQLLLNCAKILQTKSFQINAIISTSSAIEAWAQQQQINWVATLSDIDWDHNPADYLFSISNDQLIPAKVLQRIGCLSLHYHDAPLPRYAGSNSTAWAILQNETTYGISWHCIAPNVDSGDIVKQVTFPVLPDETVSSLNVKCTQHALEALTELAEELLNHSYQRIPQDRSQRSFFSRTQKPTGNGWLNWHNSADDIERLWRATQYGEHRNPFSQLKMGLGNDLLIVAGLKKCTEPSLYPAGTVIEVSASHWKVCTTTGNLLLTKLSRHFPQAVTLTALAREYHIQPGVLLPVPSDAQQQQLQTISDQIALCESGWVDKLRQFQPTTLPGAAPGSQPVLSVQALPKALQARCLKLCHNNAQLPLMLLSAWLVYLYRLTGQTQLQICLRHSSSALPPLLASDLPASFTLHEHISFVQLVQQVRAHCRELAQQPGYLNDIWLRYPELARIVPPELCAFRLDMDAQIHQPDEAFPPLPEPFIDLFSQLLRQPDTTISSVNWFSARTRKNLLTRYSTVAAPLHQKSITQLFEQQVENNPHHTAIVDEHRTWSYHEINQQANQLAHYLSRTCSIQPDELIALCLDKSVHTVIAILAVLKCAAAYVPINPRCPDNRLHYILEDTAVRVVILHAVHQHRLNPVLAHLMLVCLDSPQVLEQLGREAETNLTTPPASHHLAYVIYTSGTTGQPKGVLQTQHNVASLFKASEAVYDFNDQDVWLLFHSYVFDFSVWEMWGALLYGGRLVIPNAQQLRDFEELQSLCYTAGVTVLNQTPSAFYQLSEIILKNHSQRLSQLRYIIFGGEKLNFALLNPWFSSNYRDKPQLINMFGITEVTIVSTFKKINPAALGDCSCIGQMLPQQCSYIVDSQLSLLPNGAVGELLIGGDRLARGYLNQSGLTAERFIPNPFQRRSEKKRGYNHTLYRTGDLVRRLPDRSLEYISRNDDEVIVYGYRG